MDVKADYTNSILKSNFGYSRSSLNYQTITAGVESALYFADGRYGISNSNYSDGGFVIVTPKKALSNETIQFIGHPTKSGFLGGGAVVPVYRNQYTSARLDLTKFKNRVDIKQDTISAYGEYKRGFVEDLVAEGTLAAQGIIIDENGEPFQQITGYALHQDNPDIKPSIFFTNEDGEFIITELRPGKYKLSLNVEGIKDIHIEIKEPKNAEEIIQLGSLVCQNSD